MLKNTNIYGDHVFPDSTCPPACICGHIQYLDLRCKEEKTQIDKQKTILCINNKSVLITQVLPDVKACWHTCI